MRILIGSGLCLTFALAAFAQHPRNQGYGRYGASFSNSAGFGNVVFPGTGGPSINRPSAGFGNVVYPGTGGPPSARLFPPSPTFVERFGNTMVNGYTGAPYGRGRHRGGVGWGGVAYPVIVGGYYPGYYGDGYSDADAYQGPPPQPMPNITIVIPPQAAPAPPPGNAYAPQQENDPTAPDSSGIRTYQQPSPERPEPQDQVMFYIALKDSSVYTALAYWVQDGTLHYITTQGRHNQVSLDLVDRETSARLNAGRKVEFHLPPG